MVNTKSQGLASAGPALSDYRLEGLHKPFMRPETSIENTVLAMVSRQSDFVDLPSTAT